jgi:hypothetical protein
MASTFYFSTEDRLQLLEVTESGDHIASTLQEPGDHPTALPFSTFQQYLAALTTPTPAPDFGSFLDAVIASPLYQKVLEQSVASPEVNVAFTSTMGALILAANGRPNPVALQSGLTALLGAMTTEPADITALQQLLEDARLDGLVAL